MHEAAEDVVFDTEVIGDHVEAGFRGGVQDVGGRSLLHRRGPLIALAGGDAGGEVETGHGRDLAGAFDELGEVAAGAGEHAAHDAAATQVPHQGAGIDLRGDRDARVGQESIGVLVGAPVGSERGEFAHHEPFDIGLGGFVCRGAWRRSCQSGDWLKRRSAPCKRGQ